MNKIINWLVHSEPWVAYNTKLNLYDNADPDDLQKTYNAILDHKLIKSLIHNLVELPFEELTNHKKADHSNHIISFLAEIGLSSKTEDIRKICEKVLANISEEGIIESYINVPIHFGGSGKGEWTWMLCDAPMLVFALQKMGYAEDERVVNSLNTLVNMVFENGWHCSVSKHFGKFRGPGRKDDPCPYTNLIMLKAIASSANPAKYKKEANIGINTLLNLWSLRKETHPYLFYMGNDFCKLKFPFVWYDILHITYVLSHFDEAIKDSRFQEMLSILLKKSNNEGKYTPESVWQFWKEWDFGQKKLPSPTLTYYVYYIQKKATV